MKRTMVLTLALLILSSVIPVQAQPINWKKYAITGLKVAGGIAAGIALAYGVRYVYNSMQKNGKTAEGFASSVKNGTTFTCVKGDSIRSTLTCTPDGNVNIAVTSPTNATIYTSDKAISINKVIPNQGISLSQHVNRYDGSGAQQQLNISFSTEGVHPVASQAVNLNGSSYVFTTYGAAK